VLRGEIWWAGLPAPQGTRPVLILSRDKAVQVRSHVTVAPLSRTIRDIPSEVLLEASDGVPRRCAINLDSIGTIPKSLLRARICALDSEKMRRVRDAIRFALALD